MVFRQEGNPMSFTIDPSFWSINDCLLAKRKVDLFIRDREGCRCQGLLGVEVAKMTILALILGVFDVDQRCRGENAVYLTFKDFILSESTQDGSRFGLDKCWWGRLNRVKMCCRLAFSNRGESINKFRKAIAVALKFRQVDCSGSYFLRPLPHPTLDHPFEVVPYGLQMGAPESSQLAAVFHRHLFATPSIL